MQEGDTGTQPRTEAQYQDREFNPMTSMQESGSSNSPLVTAAAATSNNSPEEEQKMSQSNAYEIEQRKKVETINPVGPSNDASTGGTSGKAPLKTNLTKNISFIGIA